MDGRQIGDDEWVNRWMDSHQSNDDADHDDDDGQMDG